MNKIPVNCYPLFMRGGAVYLQGGKPDNATWYRLTLATAELAEISEHEICVLQYGAHYKEMGVHLRQGIHYFDHCSDPERGLHYFIRFDDGVLLTIDHSGHLLDSLELDKLYNNGHPIYGIAFQPPDLLWLAFPTGASVSQFSLSEKREIFRIGDYSFDDDHELLSYPEDVYYFNGTVYIPNMGNGNLVEVDTSTMKVTLTKTGLGRLWAYQRDDRHEVLVLEDGTYTNEAGKE